MRKRSSRELRKERVASCSMSLDQDLKLQKSNKNSNVANPDPWARLIGPMNCTEVYVSGEPVEVLLDNGAQITTIGESYCKDRGFKIHPISRKVEVVVANGSLLDYMGYVEEFLQVPGKSYAEWILLLVVEDCQLRSGLPVQLGTLTLNAIFGDMEVHGEQLDLQPNWQRVYNQILYLRSRGKLPYKPLGYVKSTKQYTISPGDSVGVHGLSRIHTYGMVVNVMTEATNKGKVPKGLKVQNTLCNLLPGSHRALVMVTNVTNKPIKLKPGTLLAEVNMANKVPKIIAPSEDVLKEAKEWEDLMDEMGIDEDVRERLIESSKKECEKVGVKLKNSEDLVNEIVGDSPSSAQGKVHVNAAIVKPELSNSVSNSSGEAKTEPDPPPEPDPGEWLMEKLDLSGLDSWPKPLQEKAKNLLKSHQSLFAKHDLDMGRTSLVKHNIILTDPVPFKEKYRRIPPQLYEEVREHLQEMLDLGAIRASNSPWSSPIVLVRKKDGRLRFCIDLRKLNLRTVKDSYSLPRIESVLEHLVGACYFSTLDLKAGYWQVELAEECKPFTAFTCGPLGFFECDTMPFGACNAPATFQRLMENCLGDLNLTQCLVYLDDIIIFSKTPEEHLDRLDAVFKRLAAAGLKLKPSKCNFFKEEISYLGHIVSKDGIKADPKKVEAVVNWEVPTTVQEVRRFLGFVGFYRRFIKGFSRIAKPLTNLLRGLESSSKRTAQKTRVEWDEQEQAAFQQLKDCLVTAPVLAYADYSLPFILHTDSSTEGLGAVLYQKQDGEERVIAYASRGLSKSEVNYPAHKLEFLALKWAVTEKFHEYLYGDMIFDVYTDNNPLTYVLTTAKLDACGHRWVAALANYNFNLFYKPGASNTDADALSRLGWPSALNDASAPGLSKIERPVVLAACVGVLRANPVYIESIALSDSVVPPEILQPFNPGMGKEQWKTLQREDPVLSTVISGLQSGTIRKKALSSDDDPALKYYVRHQKQLVLKDDVLYRKVYSDNTKTRSSHLQVILPPSLRAKALKGCHDQIGHLGRDKTLGLLRERFFWDTMYKDTVAYISKCSHCIRRKAVTQVAPMQPIHATQPLELVHMDFLQLEPSKGKIENILVVTDHFTRYAQAYPCKNQTAFTTAKVLWENFVTHYGFPDKFISDQGPNFEAHLIADLCKLAQVEKVRTTPYHPQTNGQCERFNKTLLSMLGTLPPEAKADWKLHVSSMTHAYNCTTNASTGYSPYYLLFGRHPRLPIDVELGIHRGGVGFKSTNQYVKRLQKRLQFAYTKARALANKESLRHKKLYDLRSRATSLCPNDLVLVKQVAFKGKHKLENRWEDQEYQVLEQPYPGIPVYKVQNMDNGNIRILHRNLLLPVLSAVDTDSGNRGYSDSSDEESVVSTSHDVDLDPSVTLLREAIGSGAICGETEPEPAIAPESSPESKDSPLDQAVCGGSTQDLVSPLQEDVEKTPVVPLPEGPQLDSLVSLQEESQSDSSTQSTKSNVPWDFDLPSQFLTEDSQLTDTVKTDHTGLTDTVAEEDSLERLEGQISDPVEPLITTQEFLDFLETDPSEPVQGAGSGPSLEEPVGEDVSSSQGQADISSPREGENSSDLASETPEAEDSTHSGSSSPPPRRSARTTKGVPPTRFGVVNAIALGQSLVKLKEELQAVDSSQVQWV